MDTFQVRIDEEERQMVLLAIAELSLARPGWMPVLHELSRKFGGDNGERMFHGFRATSSDRVKPGYGQPMPSGVQPTPRGD